MSVLSASTRAALERLAGLDEATAPLERLAAVRALQMALEADPAVLTAARSALEAGASWSDIAQAAQLSPAASRWRGR